MEKIETATALIDDPTLDEFLSEEFKNRKNYKYAMYFVLDSDFRENYLNNQERAESLFLTLNLMHPKYIFDLGQDSFEERLVVMSKKLKQEYNELPKPYDFDDVEKKVGLATDLRDHYPHDALTEEEFIDLCDSLNGIQKLINKNHQDE
ncbi:hypothetical protein [Lactobacillus kalixensis]|uniref:Uncharacterized protein n=1 Tax=Lactobacillus kalixensis DSM 16043 TaxID=1423763 RepID=A0A0R1UIX6_9LACO|nr:hypothetical protein [Lactobacillus kalixensis]KRL89307.1 hypothetical protein FC46_GL000863 [Lactobacillus kalixensis DSM 16043]